MVVETIATSIDWYSAVSLLLLGLITLFEFIDWSFDKDIEILKGQTKLMEQQQKTLEKIEQRLEQLYIEEVKK